MAGKTTIEWATDSWNPVRGCAIVSKGCTNCYAMRQAHRSSGPGGAYEGLTKLTKGGPVWTGKIRAVPELLDQPLRWWRPRRIFVNSMSDLFHEDVPDEFLDKVFAVMALARLHVFQVLTKRPQRMLEYLSSDYRRRLSTVAELVLNDARIYWNVLDMPNEWGDRLLAIDKDLDAPLNNVWLGVSVEDQASAHERIPLLLQVPAAVRWISAEPLLEWVDLAGYLDDFSFRAPVSTRGEWCTRGIQWVVAGGESGPGARPMHPDWVRSLRDQCRAAGVPFFFKQWGSWAPFGYVDQATGTRLVKLVFTEREKVIGGPAEGTTAYNVRRVGKKAAGRELDGRTHDEYPT